MPDSDSTAAGPLTALQQGSSPSFQVLASRYLAEYLEKIALATERLPEELVWWRPHQNALSVGNLILHLHGNLSLWISNGLGGQNFVRERAKEFTADRTHAGSELLRAISERVAECRGIIESIPDEDLTRAVQIQGYDVDVRGVIFHAVEHTGYHTGQILYIVKTLTSEHEAFDFYSRHSED
ncbi:MAG: DinB family protein [Thermoanaerobaculia bacterium]